MRQYISEKTSKFRTLEKDDRSSWPADCPEIHTIVRLFEDFVLLDSVVDVRVWLYNAFLNLHLLVIRADILNGGCFERHFEYWLGIE